MYNYNHLYYFYMTVKSDSVTSAAKHLRISQPSLSGQLKVLEKFLQVKLFVKVGRKNKLTQEGSIIYGFCRQMFELSEEMEDSLSRRSQLAPRRIYLGVSNEIANSFVVEVVSQFINNFESEMRPKVVMVSGSHEKLVEQLRFRELDAMVTQLATVSPELENAQHVEVPVNLVATFCKKTMRHRRSADIQGILKFLEANRISGWVMPTVGFKLRAETDRFFETNSLKGKFVFESDVIESLTRSVVDEVGMAFLPLIYVPQEIKNHSVFCFGPKEGFWKHRIWLACHKNNKDEDLIKVLSKSFVEVCDPLIR